MGNRKYPFGYGVCNGRRILDIKEAPVLQTIFLWYCTGASLQDVTQMLQNQEVPYEKGRVWNKNIVARILEDKRYLGANGYPAAIEQSVFEDAAAKRSRKSNQTEQRASMKCLRRFCKNFSPTEDVEQQVVFLLNKLISNSHILRSPPQTASHSQNLKQLEKQFNDAMNDPLVSEKEIVAMIFELAKARCCEIDNETYETQRLKHILTTQTSIVDLEPEFASAVLVSITKQGDQICLNLKNGQVINRRDFNE